MKGIPETRTLYDILPPKSAASGKEFARVVNLLLFHDARRRGENFALFDDRAGDFRGLDAYQQGVDGIAVGYQHKFYPSPLSDAHRKEIEESLLKTHSQLKEQKTGLGKWVLVTPQDSVEAATRKTGGDVTWFSGLKEKHKLSFELEHWGHTQLQSLFIQTPAIGLYYYPELFQDGASRRKTIQQQRTRYDKALKNEHVFGIWIVQRRGLGISSGVGHWLKLGTLAEVGGGIGPRRGRGRGLGFGFGFGFGFRIWLWAALSIWHLIGLGTSGEQLMNLSTTPYLLSDWMTCAGSFGVIRRCLEQQPNIWLAHST